MSKFIATLVLMFALTFSVSAHTFPSLNSSELGKRYLKLGNTYREAKDFDAAKKYLDLGYEIVTKQNDFYWRAVACEFLAYYHRDNEEMDEYIGYLKKAKSLYERVIDQADGSPFAIGIILESLENNNQNKPTNSQKGGNGLGTNLNNNDIKKAIEQLEKAILALKNAV